MTEVEKWMLKHYTQDLDMMKCNYCQEIFSDCNQMQNFKYHLRNMHNVLELDEHPECNKIQKNYKISSPMATCKHCKKTINLAIHGVHVLTIHLKIFHSDKSKIKISRAQNKYDITGNKATCKGCKKTLKISTCATLRRHLYNCPHFKTDFLLKKNKITKQKERKKRSHVWDKYDIMGSNATCKGCKKTVKIPRIKAVSPLLNHLYYCPHFKINLPLKKESTFEITRKRSDVWNKYDITDNNNATCKGCKKTLEVKVTSIHAISCLCQHLYRCPHFKIDFPLKKESTFEITRKRSDVWNKYDITDNNNATCKGCKKTMNVKVTSLHAISRLRQHLYRCPHFKTDFLLKKNKITKQKERKKRSRVWDKYDIMGSNATCKGCKKTVKIPRKKAVSPLLNHLYYCPHFKIDFPLKKESTFEITRKRSDVWNKYDITDNNNATCKGCKKTMETKVTSIYAAEYLRRHLQHCPHFKTDFPLKKEITFEITRKKSHIWNKYDITDNNNATCKGCKKTLEVKVTSIHAISCLCQHLYRCPYFKIDFPLKKESTFEITRKRSDVWNKYDIIDNNNATCKGCKKTMNVKVTSLHAISRLRQHLYSCPHFKIDFPLKKERTFEITRKRSDVWNKYDITDNNNATCKGCKKTMNVKVTSIHAAVSLRQHLYHCPHFKIDVPLKKESTFEITRKRSDVWNKYDITDNNPTCKGCKKTLEVKVTSIHAISRLRQHLYRCPHFKIDFPLKKESTLEITRKRSDVWNKYDVTDNNPTCKGCKKTLEVKVTSIHAISCLRQHLQHCPTRRRSHLWDKYNVTDDNVTCKDAKRH